MHEDNLHFYIVKKNSKYGIIDVKGRIKIKIENYFIIRATKSIFYIVNHMKDDKAYFWDSIQDTYIETKRFMELQNWVAHDSVFSCTTDDSLFIFNSDLKIVFQANASLIRPFNNNDFIITGNRGTLLYDYRNNILLNFNADDILSFNLENMKNRLYKIGKLNFYIDSIKASFDPFSHKTLKLIKNIDEYLLCDSSWSIISEHKYDYIWDYSEEYLIAKRNKKWTILNSDGKEVFDTCIDQIGDITLTFDKGLDLYSGFEFFFHISDQRNYINDLGFSEGLIRVKIDGRWGFLDENLTTRIPCVYIKSTNFYNGVAAVKTDNKWGYINHDGELKCPLIYDSLSVWTGKFGFYKKNNYWGILDSSFNEAKDTRFDSFEGFTDDFAVVVNKGKYQFVDIDGNLSKRKYDSISLFLKNTWGKEEDKWFYLSSTGEKLLDIGFSGIGRGLKNPDFSFWIHNQTNYKYYILDTNGLILAKSKYRIHWLPNDYIYLEDNGLFAITDKNTARITDFIFKDIDVVLDKYNESIICKDTNDMIYLYDWNLKLISKF